MIKVYDISFDRVINGSYITAATDYKYALSKIHPLINKLDIQRKLQNSKFYKRLEDDIVKGCIMPPITLAIIDPEKVIDTSTTDMNSYLIEKIDDAFVLDGIQRLNTLKRVSTNKDFDSLRSLYINFIICGSMDNLLYRMITLNNGQRPMTIRHQIEMLASNMYDFDSLELKIKTEKSSKKGLNHAFKKDDIIKSYIAFLSGSINIDNQKIIEEKMDELLAENIISSNVTDKRIEFADMINFVKDVSYKAEILSWFRTANNMIGFASGVSRSGKLPDNVEEFEELIYNMERAIGAFDVSKINLGQTRRKVVQEVISKYDSYYDKSINELIDLFSEIV